MIGPTSPAPDARSVRRPRRGWRTTAVGLSVGGVLLAGCGGDSSSTTASGASAAQGGGAPLADDAADEISLDVVGEDSTVKLSEVAATDRPTLLWFWAPH